MRYVITVFLASSILQGCVKEQNCGCVMPYPIYYLKAKITEVSDISCSKPVLDFSEDSLRIRSLTNLDNLAYSVINLPSNFIIQDKKLYVLVAKLKVEEEFACIAVGPSYPHLKVLAADNRD